MYSSCIIDIFCTLSLGTEDAPSGVKKRGTSLVLWSAVRTQGLEEPLLVHWVAVIPHQRVHLLLVVNLIVHIVDLLFLKVQTN